MRRRSDADDAQVGTESGHGGGRDDFRARAGVDVRLHFDRFAAADRIDGHAERAAGVEGVEVLRRAAGLDLHFGDRAGVGRHFDVGGEIAVDQRAHFDGGVAGVSLRGGDAAVAILDVVGGTVLGEESGGG
jgi:hypothetical protein